MSNMLTSTQKASALLISMGPERAAKVIRHLSDADVEQAIHILNDANTATKAHL